MDKVISIENVITISLSKGIILKAYETVSEYDSFSKYLSRKYRTPPPCYGANKTVNRVRRASRTTEPWDFGVITVTICSFRGSTRKVQRKNKSSSSNHCCRLGKSQEGSGFSADAEHD